MWSANRHINASRPFLATHYDRKDAPDKYRHFFTAILDRVGSSKQSNVS